MTDTTGAPDPAPDLMAGVARMRAMNPDSLMDRMGIEVLEATPDRLVATMPVAGNTQPYGLLHGGASVVLGQDIRRANVGGDHLISATIRAACLASDSLRPRPLPKALTAQV